LPVFEANGFIIKLDHYVYERVCRYISESIERNQRVYPVSVNISRVTAIQPDFKEYYADMKNRYHIPDGMLVLEFTESFADENYERLNQTITHMHRNGFLCSIDDFGSGYSSYNILKQVRMDEIKLDRFFIQKGIADDRDRLILGQVIQIAKSLGMNIVQEGVETLGEVEMLRQLGCDIVQGYYYSKPLMLLDYLSFIEEHRAK
jgi:EAL domain-containing protein (putative c-di-GMP-specific phosphodiesterase class I)